jgi:hypothetical protein
MMRTSGIVAAALVACAGSAFGQDSVSNQGASLPGDGLSPWAPGLQRTAYVVDLSPFQTSWGTTFGIAPLMKTSKTSAGFTGSLGSAQFLSNDLLAGAEFAAPSYAFWEDAPGFGVNPQTNNTPQTVSPAGASTRFAAAFSEFSTSQGGFNYTGVLGAVVNFRPSEPGRLYVKRVVAAVGTGDAATGDTAQIGFGSIDADANTYYRADDFGLAGSPFGPNIVGTNLYRTDLDARGAVVNQITGNVAALDATAALLTGSATAHNTPSNIPQSVAAGPTIATGNFNNLYVRGTASPLTADGSHLAPPITDHRGSFGSTTRQTLGSGVTNFGVLVHDANGDTTGINLFSVNAAGAVIDRVALFAPTSVTDNDDGFTVSYTGVQEFTQYASQTAFRGGVGQVAVGRDRNGMGLAAATMAENGFNDDFSTQILVARRNPATGNTAWAIAAYIDQAFVTGRSGKEILDGPGGTAIGVLTPMFNVTGGSPLGPSMSAPVLDAAGNIWFIGTVELFDRLPGGGSDFDSALMRAVYNEATFSYELELVAELGQVFAGLNSGVNWNITFMGIADSNSIDSGTMFSGNGSSAAFNNMPVASIDNNRDPRTNGGLVVNAGITYDVDGDGTFDTAGGVDEGYNALLYIGAVPAGDGPCNVADFALPFGTLDFFDVQAFLQAFSAMNQSADLIDDDVFDFFDVQFFLQAFSAGCP